jgi:hypothetical protein
MREEAAALEILSSHRRLAPRPHRRGAEDAGPLGRGEVVLDVKGVEDGGASGRKSLC